MAVAYSEEIAIPVSIESFSFMNGGGGTTLFLQDLKIYMGYSDQTELDAVFESNYITGSRLLVFETDSLFLEAGENEWCTFEFDTPFEYFPDHNLILEFEFSEGSSGMHNFLWETPCSRAVYAPSAAAVQGESCDNMIHLLLSGSELAFEQQSFAGVKVLLGQ